MGHRFHVGLHVTLHLGLHFTRLRQVTLGPQLLLCLGLGIPLFEATGALPAVGLEVLEIFSEMSW